VIWKRSRYRAGGQALEGESQTRGRICRVLGHLSIQSLSFFVALTRRHRVNQQIITRSHNSRCPQLVLPPPIVAEYFPDANKDGNRGYGRAKRYFRLNGNCADLSDIIVDLEERIAWHWPNLMDFETTLRLLDNRQNPR